MPLQSQQGSAYSRRRESRRSCASGWRGNGRLQWASVMGVCMGSGMKAAHLCAQLVHVEANFLGVLDEVKRAALGLPVVAQLDCAVGGMAGGRAWGASGGAQGRQAAAAAAMPVLAVPRAGCPSREH